MTSRSQSARTQALKLCPLFVAIAGQMLIATGAIAAPTGGTVTGGAGTIEQSGLNTTITQDTDRLAIDWQSFNVASDERVAFVQPTATSIALNRILDASGSQILGRIDANGQVILLNPNGVFFGANATVNVGSLVASGLDIDTADFMNGDLLLQVVETGSGAVINRGIINAAVGGNVALIGKQVTNTGLISANLGHVALASGRQAVVTFDEQGLLGVRVDEAALQSDLGMAPGVTNSGTIDAAGGKILLTGSVSEDLFARAVNAGDLGGGTQAVVHEDGSFTLGTSVDVLNTGTLNVNSATTAAGDVVMVGRNVNQRGAITANQTNGGDAGGIHLQANSNVRLTHGGSLSAVGASNTGEVVLHGDYVIGNTDTQVRTSGDALLTAYLQLKTPSLTAQNLAVKSIGIVRQTGALDIDGVMHLILTAGADLRFNDARNDFNRVTMDTGHTSFVSLTEANDLSLGTLDVLDSTIRITATGNIAQLDGTTVMLDGSDLHLNGANLALGERAQGSGITLNNGWLNLQFSESVQAIGSVAAPGDFNNSLITAKGYNGATQIVVRSQSNFDLAATLDDAGGMSIGGLNAATASLSGFGDITQAGAIRVSGAFTLNMSAGGSALLNRQDNDFRTLNLTLGHTSLVELTDANDLLLGNLDILDSSVTLTSLGANAMISQLGNTRIDLSDSTLAVNAARVYLGDKANAQLNLFGFSDLRAAYSKGARIFGSSTGAEEFPEFVPFLTQGDSGTTQLDAQGHGSFALNASASDLLFTLHQLTATDAQLSSVAGVRQTGALHLTGTLDLNLSAEADVQLTHAGNDINQVAATTAYTSNLQLNDANSVLLNELNLADSNVSISTAGTIEQASGSAITLADSGLVLDGTSVLLGSIDAGSGATLYNSVLDIRFSENVAVDGAISIPGDFNFSYVTVNGDNGVDKLELGQDQALDVVANLNETTGIHIDKLNAVDATLTTINTISQSGPLNLSGTLNLVLPVGGLVVLENPQNDFNLIAIESGHATAITLTDADDLLLGNWDMTDTTVTVRSVGENSTVKQTDDSVISGGDSDLTIYAANIELGANGTASIHFDNIGMLRNYFSQSLTLNGPIGLGGFSSYLAAIGTDDTNRLIIGEYADIDIASEFEDYLIDLKGGNDRIDILSDLNYGFFTGRGADRVYLVNNQVNYTVEDFDPSEDEILLTP